MLSNCEGPVQDLDNSGTSLHSAQSSYDNFSAKRWAGRTSGQVWADRSGLKLAEVWQIFDARALTDT